MDKFTEYFKDKKITVMGLGLLGRGVGDAALLAECLSAGLPEREHSQSGGDAQAGGADLIVTDLKSEEELASSLEQLKQYDNISYTLGEHKMEDFEDRDMILVAAGAPNDSEYIAHAKNDGARLTQSAALFAELSRVPIIGVTGTRGKSTVTEMIHHVLETVTGESVIKGGNVRGVSNLQLLKEVKEGSLAVMELDSWQLQGFGWAGISPQVAVFTNFMEDHLNYYQSNGRSHDRAMDLYFADKANIFINQEESDVFITTPEVFAEAQKFAAGKKVTLGQEVVLVDSSLIPEDAHLSLPGEHNRLNYALALAACRTTGLTDEEIFSALASFSGVEGRLQLLTTYNGVKIYNDNNATTPQATTAGIEAVGGENDLILIIGGSDKDIDLGRLPEAIARHCAHVVLYSGTGTERLKEVWPEEITFEEHDTLEATVEAAITATTADNTILFSPGFASFGKEYKNEYDRNDQFIELIMKQTENYE